MNDGQRHVEWARRRRNLASALLRSSNACMSLFIGIILLTGLAPVVTFFIALTRLGVAPYQH
jgi:hypothetical protein